MILQREGEGSLLIDVSGRAVARLPFRALICGDGWARWGCPVSADGERWLIPATSLRTGEREEQRAGLTMYRVPR